MNASYWTRGRAHTPGHDACPAAARAASAKRPR
jgi:hypothetical protein